MRSDAKLQKDVIDEIQGRPNLFGLEIGVAAKAGVITLTGNVPTYGQKLAAEDAAKAVHGVMAVANDTEVRLSDGATRTDTELAHAALDALTWNIEVPHERIKLAVKDGWITLEGTVDWQFQRRAAERAVRVLTGVKGVIDRITLAQPSVNPSVVKQRIAEALRRSATVDSQRISVEALDSKVVLTGSVRSWAEREDVESAVWAVPGVSSVDDRL